ncbi:MULTISPECIES: hypothetical protein [unclassified Nostoc]|nr:MULTISPECIES: hypothetical protein [unclassified Nostoc]MBE8998004.1 hypothetical protein [Nostoc sp. LEGE 12447]
MTSKPKMVPSSRARVDLPAPPEPIIKIFFILGLQLAFQAHQGKHYSPK